MKIAPGVLRSDPANLLHPLSVGMTADTCDAHTPALQGNKEQNIVCHQPSPAQHFDCEEVASRQYILVRGEELLPRSDLAPLRRWCNPMSPEDVLHRLIRKMMA